MEDEEGSHMGSGSSSTDASSGSFSGSGGRDSESERGLLFIDTEILQLLNFYY